MHAAAAAAAAIMVVGVVTARKVTGALRTWCISGLEEQQVGIECGRHVACEPLHPRNCRLPTIGMPVPLGSIRPCLLHRIVSHLMESCSSVASLEIVAVAGE